MRRPARFVPAAALSAVVPLLLAVGVMGCASATARNGGGKRALRPRLVAVDLSGGGQAVLADGPVVLSGARNEWLTFAVQLADLPPAGHYTLRLRPPRLQGGDATVPADAFEAQQVLTMPVDVNRAGYVRHTGNSAAVSELPRALLPVGSAKGVIDLGGLRRAPAARAADNRPAAYAAAAPVLWIDLHVPPNAAAGDYNGSWELFEGTATKPLATLPLGLTIYDFALPEDRSLQVVGRLSWESLVRLYPDAFENVTPRLLARSQPKYASAVRTLDRPPAEPGTAGLARDC
jgi:hypothetical protein